jgi:hypothetical protein
LKIQSQLSTLLYYRQNNKLASDSSALQANTLDRCGHNGRVHSRHNYSYRSGTMTVSLLENLWIMQLDCRQNCTEVLSNKFQPGQCNRPKNIENFLQERISSSLKKKKHQMPYNNNSCWPAGIILLLLPLVRIGCPPKLVSYRNNRNLEPKLVSALSETRRLFW